MNSLEQLSEHFKDHADNDERNFKEIREMLVEINKKLDPVVDVYKAVLLSKGFVVGLASVILAIGAIGAGIVWLVNESVHK